MHGIMFAVGYSLSAWIGFGCYFISASGSTSSFPWRFPLAFQCVPALILLIGSPWLPFSPRWLLQQDRPDEAFAVIRRLHKTKDDPEEIRSKKEFFQMQKQLELDRTLKRDKGPFEIFSTAPNRKRAAIGFTALFGFQFTVSPFQNPLTGQLLYRGILTTHPGCPHYCKLWCSSLYLPWYEDFHATSSLRPLGHSLLPWQRVHSPHD